MKEEWETNHVRYYRIAGLTIKVESDLPITDTTFHPKFRIFQVDGPGEDTISIRHHFFVPNLNELNLGKEIYSKPPWTIFKCDDTFFYLGISPNPEDKSVYQLAVFNYDHTNLRVFHRWENTFLKGRLKSLSLLPTDQILLSRVLADREGCYLHSCGVSFNGKGILFPGHSGAGKSTIAKMLMNHADTLCDDRIIVRRWNNGFRIHGTWSHGDIPEISANSAPLRAILFLNKSSDNRLILVPHKKQVIGRLIGPLVRPLLTADWWDKILRLTARLSSEIPCYDLYYDMSGSVIDVIRENFCEYY